MQYTRIFMPLASETTGYEYKGKTPAGRCLLESRSGEGKLLLWAQDLKPEALYRVYLIFPEGAAFVGIPLCALTVKSNGKAELRHNFNATDIEGYGRSMENCNIVAVLAHQSPGTTVTLCGYRDTPIAWRNAFRKLERAPIEATIESTVDTAESADEVPQAAPQEKPKAKPKAKAKTEPASKSTAKTSIKSATKSSSKRKSTIELPPELTPAELEALSAKAITFEVSPPESPTEPTEEDDVKLPESPPGSLEDETEEEGPFDYFGLKAAFEAEVDEIMRSHTRMYPFRKQKRSVHWARISLDEDLTLPEYANELLSTPFVGKAYRQYSHLLLGKTADDGPRRYYIGVPSIYEPADKIVGFRQFKSCENETPVPGDYGYWLIFMS